MVPKDQRECEELLRKEFPYLYRKVVCGIELPPGWYELVRELSHKLVGLVHDWNDELNLDEEDPNNECDKEIFIDQIKEKFGSLRVYLSYGTKEMYDLIHVYEQKSGIVCESCGRPGTKQHSSPWSWIKTLCDEHGRS